MEGTDQRLPLYLRIEEVDRRLRVTLSEQQGTWQMDDEPQLNMFPDPPPNVNYFVVSRTPADLAYLLREIRTQHPEYRIVPDIKIKDPQFFLAYQTQIGRKLEDFLKA